MPSISPDIYGARVSFSGFNLEANDIAVNTANSSQNEPDLAFDGSANIVVWQDNRTRLEALPGWPLLERCIADIDDGEILTLAVEAPGLGFAVLAWAAKDAEAVLERKIACVVHRWVQPALVERGVRIGVSPSIAAHRRDGETVTLDDPAWRVWSAGIGMVEGLPCEAAALACLPDDLDSEGLVLAVPSFREAKVILDHPQDLAKAFGVTVRKQFMSWIDVANKVRAINQ